jgi:tetratricopeptide (TPR) repeat protein
MAKYSSRRRVALEDPEEVLNLAQRWLEPAKRYWKPLLLGTGVIVVLLVAWGVHRQLQASREDRAAEALVQLRQKFPASAADAGAAGALKELAAKYQGTRAANEAQLLRANLLYKSQDYAEAAKAYEALAGSPDPGWNVLVAESLSYCFEALGDYRKAAAALKPVAEQSTGAFHSEVLQRLAMLSEKAGDPKEAAEYWRKLLKLSSNPGMSAYLQERIAAAEAGAKNQPQ